MSENGDRMDKGSDRAVPGKWRLFNMDLLDACVPGCLGVCVHECMRAWVPGCMRARVPGCLGACVSKNM